MAVPTFRRRWFLYAVPWLAGCAPSASRDGGHAPPGDAPPELVARDLEGGRGEGTDGKRAVDEASELDAGVSDGGDDPNALHKETKEELLALFALKPMRDAERLRVRPEAYLDRTFGIGGPARVNQGNKALSVHTIGRAACLERLKNVTIQTPEQRDRCGAPNMVPAWLPGKAPWFCIDTFEFPNAACELPMVWTSPSQAKTICELQGKRLCSQIEWSVACRGDPEGGKDRRYAYGDDLDLDVCHTKRPKRPGCDTHTAQRAFASCGTDTEPSGSFPACRSRFGVFDQHGNVAEIMMRRDAEGEIVSQLKGSAWFYEKLAKEPGKPAPATSDEGAYPDHCNFDPRWHVETLSRAQHVNYHLGFRCCKSIP